MSSRDEEIKYAAKVFAHLEQGDWVEGAKWADQNPLTSKERLNYWREELAASKAREAKLVEALEAMHSVLKNRQYENHLSLGSNPPQNGCLVYSEWKLKDIKEKALAEHKGEM